MPRFFVSSSDIKRADDFSGTGIEIVIRGEDALHISRVLRMKIGERLVVCDDNGREYETEVISLGENVVCGVLSEKQSENEPPYKAAVFQSLAKGERFDTVIQKSTEMGADEIYPVISSRCTVKLDKSDCGKKVARWQRIAYEASKQCGRAKIPTVHEPIVFRDAVETAKKADIPLFCYEGEGTIPLSRCLSDIEPRSVSIMVGPEGGYSDEEAALAAECGMLMTGLGKRILRTESAAMFVLACLSLEYEM